MPGCSHDLKQLEAAPGAQRSTAKAEAFAEANSEHLL
jgi:hypothetical protein